MLESQTSLAVGTRETDESERPVNFQFSITWSFLFAVPVASKATSAAIQTADRNRIAPAVLRPDPCPTPSEPETLEQPIPSLQSLPPFYSRPSSVPKLFLAAAVLVAIGVPVWRHAHPTQLKPKSAQLEMEPRGGGWIRVAASNTDAGNSEARALNIYQPSVDTRNGQFEFTWTADSQGAAWVFRAKDIANYYAVRMKVLSETPSLRLSVDHFTVYLGNEGAHSEKVLDLPRNSSLLRIKMDVSGPSFTLYLDGNAVDYWTDARLTSGGFGFLEERHQAPAVRAVRMSLAERVRTEQKRNHRDIGALLAVNRLYIYLAKPAPASGGV